MLEWVPIISGSSWMVSTMEMMERMMLSWMTDRQERRSAFHAAVAYFMRKSGEKRL